MPIAVTALYAGLNALLALALAVRVSLLRVETGRLFGGGEPRLDRAVRVHANNAEYLALILLLMGLLELQGAPLWALHGLGVALTLGRLLHAWGLARDPGRTFGRFVGTGLTWLALLGAALGCLAYGLGLTPPS